MNRVRMLLGLLALFFSCDLYAAESCTVYLYKKSVSSGFSNYETWTCNASKVCTGSGSYVIADGYNVEGRAFSITDCTGDGSYSCVSGGIGSIPGSSYHTLGPLDGWQLISSAIGWSDYASMRAAGVLTCDLPACNTSDDDNDGVCNSCDTKPGESDPKHCIWTQSVTATGQVVTMVIDQSGNCDGSQTVTYTNSSLASEKTYWDLSTSSQEITAPSCQGDDGTGNCACGYPKSDSIFTNFEQDTNTELTEDLKNQIQDQKENKDDPNYDDCSNIKARCEAACLSRGGVVTNTCTVSGGLTYGKCTCQNEYAFDIATNTETSDDTSTGGDVAETGGDDTNLDGKSDVYAAVKDAIHDSGLTSQLDSTNGHLNSIGNKIDTVGSAVNGVGDSVDNLGGKLDGIADGINDLSSKIDALGNKDVTATGSADLPDSNTYNPSLEEIPENKLADAISNFISSGLPIVSYFRGSYIDVGSSEPSLSTEIFGKTITIDFSSLDSVLNNMGLVLVFVSTILAFMIIVHKG